MSGVVRGSLEGRGLRIAIVVSRFNEEVTSRLLDGARAELERLGMRADDVRACSVPGAVEIPGVAQRLARSGACDAVIALGAVIRGETSHYDVVCDMVAQGCLRVALDTGVPVAFGILTCDDEAQALARSEDGEAHKGREAARVAIEMANLYRELAP